MNNVNIYILTGSIQTGKTTKLLQWSTHRNDVYGILTPIINDRRMFMDIASKEQFMMEAVADEIDVLAIGRYTFSAKAFKKATQILIHASLIQKEWLVIDEIGPLEVNKQGFYDCIKTILEKNNTQKIILVVRKNLLTEVLSIFNLKEDSYQIIEISSYNSILKY